MKWSLAYTASSPFVCPLINSPPTKARRSRLRLWVLSGSEKEADGGELKGGGKGLGVRLAKRATPVSKRKGILGDEAWDACRTVGEAR